MVNLSWIVGLVNENSIKIISAILIILIGVVISRFLSKLIYKLLISIQLSKFLKNKINMRLPLEEVISYIIKYLGYFVSLVAALNYMGVGTFVQQFILILILIMIASIVFFSLKDFVPNFIAGLIIHRKNLLKEGDNIKIMGIEGRVSTVDLLYIKIVKKEKELFILPNSVFTKAILKKKVK